MTRRWGVLAFAGLVLGTACSGSDTGEAASSESASAEAVQASAKEFADATCSVVQGAEARYGDIDVSLNGAEPGSEEYRAAVIEFLEAVGDMVDGFGRVNAEVELVGSDAVTFQLNYGEAMEYSRERVDEYIAALSEADAPVVNLDEIYDDVLGKVQYSSTTTGQAVQQAIRNCDIGG